MALALDQFVKSLEDSGIVAPGKLENFLPPKAAPQSAEELARELVAQKHLTKFQAYEICQGRASSLILGGYTILDKIGAGGMGEVFQAQHRRMRRVVAIKVLPQPVMQDALAVARFQREVEAAAKLSHPNIVAAYDADEAGGIHFLAMEYVAGSDLSALVKTGGPLPVDQARDYILQAARGLEFAHGAGVVHRDIKPSNLLLDHGGTVKVLDLGLARLDTESVDAQTRTGLTDSGAMMGTVDYMAPEQALNTRLADERSDVYSLGCTLYYLLSGKPPYKGDTLMEKLLAHREQPIPRLAAVSADVPPRLQAVFDKMLAKAPNDRYQSMSALIADLQACAAPSAAPARKRLSLVSGGLFGAVILAAATFCLWPNRDATPEKNGASGPLAMIAASATPGRKDGPPEAPPPAIAPFDSGQAREHQEAWAKYLGVPLDENNSIGMTMVLIPPGEFLMGSSDEQVEAAIQTAVQSNELYPAWVQARIRDAERPQHKVVLTRPLAMSATETTIGQFRRFVEATKYVTLAETLGGDSHSTDANHPGKKELTWRTPGYAVTDDSPVTQVSWMDAAVCCNWLCEQEHFKPSYRQDAVDGWVLLPEAIGYRLPTEAQWEYACRAGTTTQYWFGDDPAELAQYDWWLQNGHDIPQPVGRKRPNPFGMFDMQGNVAEWCQDWLDDKWYATSPMNDPQGPLAGAGRVARGGGSTGVASCCRVTFRTDDRGPARRDSCLGFRVVRGW